MKAQTFIVSIFTTLAALAANAQQPSSTPVVLPNPILAKMPSMAAWTITVLSRQSPQEPNSAEPGKAVPSAKFVFVKTEPLMHVTRIDASGHEIHQWCVGATQYVLNQNSADVGVMDPEADDYITGDFQNLSWIKEPNFSGMKPYKGKQCWVFKDRVLQCKLREFEDAKKRAADQKNLFDENIYYQEEVAYIDSESRLPMVVQRGDDFYVYTYEAPPTALLTLPENLKQKVHADLQASRAMKAGPPRPF